MLNLSRAWSGVLTKATPLPDVWNGLAVKGIKFNYCPRFQIIIPSTYVCSCVRCVIRGGRGCSYRSVGERGLMRPQRPLKLRMRPQHPFGGRGGMRARRGGTRAKRTLSAHTQLSRPRSPPQAKGGGEKSRLVQNPRQSPPQTEGEGGKRPRQCGTRAKRALCAHTHSRPRPPPGNV